MLQLSQSFSMGHGCLEHNLRITKGAGLRQNGDVTRRHLNEDVIVRGDVTQKDYERNLLINVVKEKIGDELAKHNERMLQTRHPERVMTVEQWLDKKAYTRAGKKKRIIREYVINLGNRHTCCPYIQHTDSQGNLLDKSGKVIPMWDTRRAAAIDPVKGYDKKGNIKESEISKKVKPVLRDFVEAFKKRNPQAEILGYSIHCDEGGAVHAHLSVLWFSKLKTLKNGGQQGVGWGIAETEAIRQQYEAQGIKCGNTRTDNAQNRWRKDMRDLLKDIALTHGIERLDMGNKEPHRDVGTFGSYKDKYCNDLETEYNRLEKVKEIVYSQKEAVKAEREAVEDMSVSDIAKGEWYLLKKNYPDIYKQIHVQFINNRTKIRNRQNNNNLGKSL